MSIDQGFAAHLEKVGHRKKADLPLWDNLIDKPLEHERSEEKASGGDAQEAGQVPGQEWADLI